MFIKQNNKIFYLIIFCLSLSFVVNAGETNEEADQIKASDLKFSFETDILGPLEFLSEHRAGRSMYLFLNSSFFVPIKNCLGVKIYHGYSKISDFSGYQEIGVGPLYFFHSNIYGGGLLGIRRAQFFQKWSHAINESYYSSEHEVLRFYGQGRFGFTTDRKRPLFASLEIGLGLGYDMFGKVLISSVGNVPTFSEPQTGLTYPFDINLNLGFSF